MAVVALFNDHADRALWALDDDGTNAQRLDGFLQRFEGDLLEQMAASEHSEEIMSAKTADSAEEIQQVVALVYRRRLTTLARGVAADIDA